MVLFIAFRGADRKGPKETRKAAPEVMGAKNMAKSVKDEEPGAEVEVKEVPPAVDCKVYPFKHYSKDLKDRLPDYKTMSLQAGIRPLKDDDALASVLAKGGARLVHVKDDDALHVAQMTHGKPYLTPQAYQVLRSIGQDFKARIAGTDLADARLKVTSLLRTSKDQHDLGRSNVNATRDADAPHTHGTSVDISYMKFVNATGEQMQLSGCQQVFLAETLAEVIAEYRKKDGRLFATKEKQQACYHLTVCR
jgi:hypothetical protein